MRVRISSFLPFCPVREGRRESAGSETIDSQDVQLDHVAVEGGSSNNSFIANLNSIWRTPR